MLSWESVRKEFAFDGSWRDIYVMGAGIAGWQRMLDWLRLSGYDYTYYRSEQPAELPTRVEDIFPYAAECDRLLSEQFRGVLANCHFFTPDEIEFDIDPRQVTCQPQLDAVISFMSGLADSVERDAILCPEGYPKIVIFRVQPRSGVVEQKAGKLLPNTF
jgi:hypothetical protein